ncbi:MAG: hypothetical protein IJQ85_09855 [Selenomonadaceae bacterium]|nr:hypothetical protein [Selenomonadaceae bacterium]
MIFDEIRTLRIIKDAPNAHIVKIFFWLAFHQPQDGIHGYKIQKSQIAGDLNLGRTVLFESLHWLKDNLIINELSRLKLDDEKIRKNRELKRRRELNKLKKDYQQ